MRHQRERFRLRRNRKRERDVTFKVRSLEHCGMARENHTGDETAQCGGGSPSSNRSAACELSEELMRSLYTGDELVLDTADHGSIKCTVKNCSESISMGLTTMKWTVMLSPVETTDLDEGRVTPDGIIIRRPRPRDGGNTSVEAQVVTPDGEFEFVDLTVGKIHKVR